MKKILVLSPFYHYPGHFKEIGNAFYSYKDKNKILFSNNRK